MPSHKATLIRGSGNCFWSKSNRVTHNIRITVNRAQLALQQDGITMSKSTVRRVMKKGGLIRASPRRSGSLTELDADAQKADNLIRLNSKDFLLMTAMMVS